MHDVYRGRVEVLYNGVWGRICEDEDWSIRESDVVCRQLGYDGALLNAYIGGRFDVDVGVIGFTSVRCIGNENSISNCRGRQWRVVQSCGYGYDSGVMCNPPGKKMASNLNIYLKAFPLFYLFYFIQPGQWHKDVSHRFFFWFIDFLFVFGKGEGVQPANITKK